MLLNIVRDNILLRQLPVPKRMQLPTGLMFFAKYERVSRANLPRNVTIKRKRTIRPRNRCKQRGQGMTRKFI